MDNHLSERSVTLLIDNTSYKSRAAPTVELADILDEMATKYLSILMPDDIASNMVALTGGCPIQMIIGKYVSV